MDRLGLVARPGRGTWRLYAGPAAFLLVAALAVWLIRSELHGSSHATAPLAPPAHAAKVPPRHTRRVYVVRTGDTIAAISVKTHVPQTRILALNPKVSPTALFIGERLRLR
jgi:spore germination protein YaaH